MRKHKVMKKCLSICLALLLCALPVSIYAAGETAQPAAPAEQKISDTLYEEFARLEAQGKNMAEEKIPVWVWYKDVNQTQVDNITKARTGLTVENAAVDYAMPSPALLNSLQNEEPGSQAQMQAYLAATAQARALEAQRADTLIMTRREVAREQYNTKSAAIIEETNLDEDDIIFKSQYAPMIIAEMTQEELVQEVLDRVLQSSTGVEDLETVTSLSGVKSLPGEKDGKMVNVPLELIGKPASDAAVRAEAAAKKAEGAVAGLEEKTQAATEAATKANEAAAKAENAAAKVEQTTAAAIGGATARFSSWMETGNVLPDKSTKPGGSVVYVADAGKFAYHMDSTLYGDWDVAGVPPAGIFMNADRTAILPDKLYLLGDAVYTGTGGSLRLLAYRHEVMSGEAYEALQDKDANTLYLIYEED